LYGRICKVSDGIPHLIYISREKRPKNPHHYKAGAMNTRVSGLMTNAPFMLNVDCDMYANNPELVLHAMCLFLGSSDERDWGFVQCPQYFYDRPTDHLAVLHQVQELFIDEMLCMVCGRVRWIIKENMLMNLMVLCFLISYFCYESFFFWAFGFYINPSWC
ncbi:hypothetical protein CUMW_188770, partial [Citrus unshiu]